MGARKGAQVTCALKETPPGCNLACAKQITDPSKSPSSRLQSITSQAFVVASQPNRGGAATCFAKCRSQQCLDSSFWVCDLLGEMQVAATLVKPCPSNQEWGNGKW